MAMATSLLHVSKREIATNKIVSSFHKLYIFYSLYGLFVPIKCLVLSLYGMQYL